MPRNPGRNTPLSTERTNELERRLEIILQTGLLLAKTYDLKTIVQGATDAGLQLCGAQFGAFLYNVVDDAGESYLLYALSGADREKSLDYPARHETAAFSPILSGTEIVRSPDITNDPKYENYGLPKGDRPVRSYLAVPVKNSAGKVLGGLFYGHEDVDVFEQSSETLLATVAAQAAIAIENSILRSELTRKIRDLEKIGQNIKKIELSQKQSAKSLGELAAIVASSDDAIISKDLNGVISSWNLAATRILGYTAEEMIGQPILKIIPEHLHSDEKVILTKIRAGERIEHFETVRLTKSGQLIDVSLTVSPVKDQTGEIIGASKILRDITSRKSLERSLLQAEKIAATGRMAATIAHEINNPLEAVVNLLYLLRSTVADTEGREYLSAAESELGRVSHIAKRTLGYYREQGSATSTSIAELVGHAATIYGPRCAASNIQIEKCFESTSKIVARKGEIMQVISNLVANSIYAMPAGGKLRVLVKDTVSPAPGILLTVEDTGAGIPSSDLPRIFDAFFTTRSTIGTGIGLFVAKQFIEGHGGDVKVRSSVDPVNHGTTVTVFLPLHTAYEDAG